MVKNKKIPNGWERVKTDLIGNLLRGISYKKGDAINEPQEGYLPILRANNINGELNFSDLVYVPKKYIEDFQIIKAGDIVFAMSSGSKHLVGKSAVAKNDFDGSYGAFCSLLRINDLINKKYIAYIFKGNSYRKLISEIAKGTNINNLKREHILDFEISLPPLHEQNRIVAKIEELFSSLDNGIESLKTAQQQLKVYRQAVLKWAFEGKLTNKNVKDGELPAGWKWIQFGDVSNMCLGKMLDKVKNKGTPQPYLRNISVRWGTFVLSNLGKMKFEESEKEKYSLKKGDLVICEGGEPGRCAIWMSNEPMYIQKALHRVRMHSGYDAKYAFYFILFSALNGHLEKYFTGTTIKHLTGKELQKVTVTIPPTLDEQRRIVAEIESRLSVCDKIEESIEQSLKQSESLRQSILKKAFEGKLVPQDPSDEPASKLLERIKAEKEKNKKVKR